VSAVSEWGEVVAVVLRVLKVLSLFLVILALACRVWGY
jgi:hypothetical protein